MKSHFLGGNYNFSVLFISKLTEEQALRVSWRILKDWIEAQMAIVESELATLPEVFLPYAVTKNGTTLYRSIESNNTLLLT